MDWFTDHPSSRLTRVSRLQILHIHHDIIEYNPTINDLCTSLQYHMSENGDFLISLLSSEVEEENISMGA